MLLLNTIREYFLSSSWLLVVCWKTLVFLGLLLLDPNLYFIATLLSPVHLCLPMVIFFMRTLVILDLGSTLLQYNHILTNYICNNLISK